MNYCRQKVINERELVIVVHDVATESMTKLARSFFCSRWNPSVLSHLQLFKLASLSTIVFPSRISNAIIARPLSFLLLFKLISVRRHQFNIGKRDLRKIFAIWSWQQLKMNNSWVTTQQGVFRFYPVPRLIMIRSKKISTIGNVLLRFRRRHVQRDSFSYRLNRSRRLCARFRKNNENNKRSRVQASS